MKRGAVLLALLLFPFLLSASPKVAVLDVIVSQQIDPSVVVPVTETIMEEVVSSKAFTVLDRSYVAQVLKEKEFQVSGLVSDAQIVKVGQYLGADFVIAGRAQYVADSYFLVAKMIDVKTGVITAQTSETGQGKVLMLLELARTVGRKLAGGGGPSVLASQPSRPARGEAAAKLSVGFIYGNEAGAQGVPFPPEAARLYLQEKHKDWLASFILERVPPEGFADAVERLVEEHGCRLIVTSDVWLIPQVLAVAPRHPDVIFEEYGWSENRPPNVGMYALNDIHGYYLMGLLAGAASRSGKIAFPAPQSDSNWHRIINEFALGVKAVNSKAVVIVRFLGEDYWSPASRPAEEALIREGCDVFAPADSPWLFEAARRASSPAKKVFVLGMRMPWQMWRDIAVTGPWEDWSGLYEKVFLEVRDGSWRQDPLVWGLREGALKFGGMGEPFNPDIAPLLSKVRVRTPDFGELTVLELVLRRAEQMRSGAFEPFTGPIRDQRGKVRIQKGERLDSLRTDWSLPGAMDWLVDNVKGTFPDR
jgi:simple sugar transport system substrate-binding protein